MRRAIPLAFVLACGPVVGTEVDDTTGGEDTTGPVTATSTTMPPGTSTSTSTSTGGADTTSSSAEVGEGEQGETVDSLGFIQEPDSGGICHCECDVWAQDCPDGERCVPWANDGGDVWNATRCSPIDPNPAAVGETCHAMDSGVSGFDDCELGAFCWGVDPVTLEGTCVANCHGSEANPQCADGLTCTIAFEGVLILCLPGCDPLAPTCALDETCSGDISSSFVCLPTPPFEAVPYGEPCGELRTCASGLGCVSPEQVPGCEENCCTTLGDLAQMPICPDPAQTCLPIDDAMPDEGLCYCGVPA